MPHKLLFVFALLLFPLVAGVQLVQPYILKEAVDGPIKEGATQALSISAAAGASGSTHSHRSSRPAALAGFTRPARE